MNTAMIVKQCALSGAKYGATCGAGLGVGGGMMASIATPLITMFYAKWDLTKPTSYPLYKSIPTFVLGGALVGGLVGGTLGAGAGLVRSATTAGLAYFKSRESTETEDVPHTPEEPSIRPHQLKNL